jgi:putative spermidine/putrescine transport system ATP-binding protein
MAQDLNATRVPAGAVAPDGGRMADPILELVGVEKTLGKTQVVHDLNLAIGAGEFVTLLGPSGCGKSTTLNLVAGLLQPDAGSIYLRGHLVNMWEPRRRRLGMVFQTWALFPHMTVYENVAFGLRVQRLGRDEIRTRVAEMLALVRLPGIEEKYPSQLSGGMQQRVALARAIATRPDILLLDEPLSNLDARLRKEMQFELRRIHDRLRVTTIFVTHSQEEALVLSDRIAVMNHGVIVRIDSPERLYKDPRTRFVCTFLGDANILECRVSAVDGDHALVEHPIGRLAVAASARLRAGDHVGLALRPEAVSIRAARSPDAANSVPATIRDAVYKGEAIVYYLDASGTDLIALEYPKAAVPRTPGARVFAEFEATALSVLDDA